MNLKFILLSTLAICSGLAHAQRNSKDQFLLQGKILNRQEGWVYLSYSNAGKYIIDSAALKKGTFRFNGFINEPTLASFTGRGQIRSIDDLNATYFYIEPGVMEVTVTYNAFKSARIKGSKTQNEYLTMQVKLDKIRNRWKGVMDTLEAVNKKSNFQYQEMKNWVLRPYEAEIHELQMDFIERHPNSYATAQTLVQLSRNMPVDSVMKYYNRFSEKLKQSSYAKEILAGLEKRKIGAPGTVAKDFARNDINGNGISLSDYKGKYVMLDFWASWCVPCRKGNPHLLGLYAKYKDKGFEIIGISDDDSKPEAWKKAVNEDKIGVWKHVLRELKWNGQVPDRTNDISENYGIHSLPTKILIDPNGKIIGRYGGGGEGDFAMDKKLIEIFGS